MKPSPLSSLPFEPSLLEGLEKRLAAEQKRRLDRNKLTSYRPYAKQVEFHSAGSIARERLLMAANQSGKTYSAAMEVAMHMTGRYPQWWQGYRFDRPTRGICGSESVELTKKGVQRLLLGNPETPDQWGTGSIPADALLDTSPRQGVPNAVSSIVVRHVSGGTSIANLASYDQGRTKWQADTLDWAWPDEEPPEPVYMEILTRTNISQGPVFTTFTPLFGMTEVVRRFYPTDSAFPNCHLTMMTIDDAEHYTPEQRAKIVASYPKHERDARTRGIPILGSGRVFPVSQDEIEIPAFSLPDHWVRIAGLDFGWDHPSAAAALAWDRDADVIYVYDCHRQREQTPAMFSQRLKGWGPIPVAWPHDGLQHEKGSGEQLAKQYKDQGLSMLPGRATFEDGTSFVEPGITEILDRMQSGRWRVFSHLNDYWEEHNLYHRKEGLIVKKGDDIMSAARYGMMMRRFARTLSRVVKPQQRIATPRPGSQGWMG